MSFEDNEHPLSSSSWVKTLSYSSYCERELVVVVVVVVAAVVVANSLPPSSSQAFSHTLQSDVLHGYCSEF